MNPDGTWPHQFITESRKREMTSFWERMQRHSQDRNDFRRPRDTSWLPAYADVSRVNWAQCRVENWKYQWFLDQTGRAPQWQDLPDSYRQWWIYTMLPTHRGLDYYLNWMWYDIDEYDRKQRQLQTWIDLWNSLQQLTKMQYFDPVLPTAHVHAAKWQVGDRCGPNPYTLKERACM